MNDIHRPSVVAREPEEMDLVTFIRVQWRHRIMVASACFLGGVVAVIFALLATPIYRAQAILAEVRDREMGGGSGSLATEIGGLASLAGVDVAGAGGAGQENMAVLDSRHLVEEFVRRNNLLPELLRHSKKPPTMWLAVQTFKDGVIAVHKDLRKGVISVTIEWTDAATAAAWANGFVALANDVIRRRAIEEASRNVVYLNDQLSRTTDLELRKVIYNLIETQTKALMLANGRAEYAFEIVDPAVPPEIRTRPHRTLMALVGLTLGLTLGMGAAVLLERFERSKRESRGAAV